MAKTIDRFSDDYEWLSNFSFSPIVVRTEIFPNNFRKLAYATVEHAYQASKMTRFIDSEKIRHVPSASQARKLGRSLPMRSDWSRKLKLRLMEQFVDLKFPLFVDLYRDQGYIPDLTQRLIGTGEAELIEGNWWGNIFWGVCNGEGENNLGLILVEQRTKINVLIDKIQRQGRQHG